jgi:hypothetical protein
VTHPKPGTPEAVSCESPIKSSAAASIAAIFLGQTMTEEGELARDVVDDGGRRADLLLGERSLSAPGQSAKRCRRPEHLQ